MHYQSIIRFLDYVQLDYTDVSAIQIPRLKKIINAEFAMSEDGFIVIDGYTYSKNDVLKEIEQPDFVTQHLGFHLKIWDTKSLLRLLEDDKISFSDDFAAWHTLAEDPGFVAFISPGFSKAFNSVMKSVLQVNDFYTAGIWIDFLKLVKQEDEEEALRSLRLYLDDTIKVFRNLNDTTYHQRWDMLRYWREGNWADLVNRLPESMFYYHDELASAVINFTVRIQNADKELCYDLSSQLIKLQYVTPTLRELIIDNHVVYSEKVNKRFVVSEETYYQPHYESTSSEGPTYGTGTKHSKRKSASGKSHFSKFYIVLLILIVLGRLLKNCDSGTHSTSSFKEELPTISISEFTNTRSAYTHFWKDEKATFSKDTISYPVKFTPGKLYLVLEGNPELDSMSSNYILFENNTGLNLNIYTFIGTSYNISNLDAFSKVAYEINPKKNYDFILASAKYKPRKKGEIRLDFQYLHLQESSKKIALKDSLEISPCRMRYYFQGVVERKSGKGYKIVIDYDNEGYEISETQGYRAVARFSQ